jgi:hypothetical protein
MQAIDSPTIAALCRCDPRARDREPAEEGRQIPAVRERARIWCLELEARGKGNAQEIEKELRANLLPGVTIVGRQTMQSC